MTNQYRPNVCLLILNSKNEIFLGLRDGTEDHWQFPQGGIDTGESVENAAMREFQEELGVDAGSGTLLEILSAQHTYDFDTPRPYGGETYKGQTQKYAVIRFVGDDTKIKLHEVEEPEFSQFKWTPISAAISLAHPIRREGYERAIRELMERYSK